MLDSLITSRTRIKLLLKFFTNSRSSAHLRALAKEMHESTNAVRLELNKLSRAGFLLSYEDGKTIKYCANTRHPLFPELSSLVRKYLGLDKIVENIVQQIGDIEYACITGDYAEGKDSGIIELHIAGKVERGKLDYWVKKTEKLIKRTVHVHVIGEGKLEAWKMQRDADHEIVLWTGNTVA